MFLYVIYQTNKFNFHTQFKIVTVGTHYNYANDDHSEYLLIVSKEYGINDHINDTDSSDKRKVSD